MTGLTARQRSRRRSRAWWPCLERACAASVVTLGQHPKPFSRWSSHRTPVRHGSAPRCRSRRPGLRRGFRHVGPAELDVSESRRVGSSGRWKHRHGSREHHPESSRILRVGEMLEWRALGLNVPRDGGSWGCRGLWETTACDVGSNSDRSAVSSCAGQGAPASCRMCPCGAGLRLGL